MNSLLLTRRNGPVFLFLSAILFSQEAQVTVMPEYIDLNQLIERSNAIAIATKRVPTGSVKIFEIIEPLLGKASDFEKGKIIPVEGANDDLYRAIGEAQKRGEPTPFSILPFYKGKMTADEYVKTDTMILFLFKLSDAGYKFAVEEGYEAVSEKQKVIDLVTKRGKKK